WRRQCKVTRKWVLPVANGATDSNSEAQSQYNSNESIESYNARLVAKGFTQTYDIDYSETFAPAVKLNTVRILSSLAANLDWPLHQLDLKVSSSTVI
ncbi:hypothetical protein A2U01_0045729, partial [Trifolium medium]|nr:hypothetical protein [Trifolium medium]